MLEKSKYYHGAALVRLMEDERCISVQKRDGLGYVINNDIFVLLKYRTNGRSPWGFGFDQEDVDRCVRMAGEYRRVAVGLICGGDGVCALDWTEANMLLGGKAAWIKAERKHNHSYTVWGTEGELKNKIPVTRWPKMLFETIEESQSFE